MPAGSGRYPSGQRGQTVNLLAYAFGGSNPPLPTIVSMGWSAARSEGGLSGARVAPTGPVDPTRPVVVPTRPVIARVALIRCGNSSAVERQPSKLGVAGSNPVSRSIAQVGVSLAAGRPAGPAWTGNTIEAHVAQSVEHVLGKDGVTGSSPVMGSSPLARRRVSAARGG
jgi:hypothetical protein